MTQRREVARIADVAMYDAVPMPGEGDVHPTVTLLSMTHNPLRVMAAASALYSGGVKIDVNDVTGEQALKALRDVEKTTLKAPLEFIDFHFFIQGVTRAFTHQLVRQRTGVYVQESMRFAVKRGGMLEVAIPPSIARLKEDAPQRIIWENAIHTAMISYERLVDSGIPAEDARGLLPTNITTRIHYKTNLRNLSEHAGYRLCSQAQYEWKQVWEAILYAIQRYPCPADELWQQSAIVSLFKPICYATGKCEFMAETDRFCNIRERVERYHQAGIPSSNWSGIDPREALQEGAARMAPS